MNSLLLQQILSAAVAGYYDILAALLEMLRQNGAALGLMIPGLPEQLGLYNGNGVDVTRDGVPLYRAVVRRRGDVFRSPMAFGQAVQAALDETCYANCMTRLRLLRVDTLPGDCVGLTLTWEG